MATSGWSVSMTTTAPASNMSSSPDREDTNALDSSRSSTNEAEQFMLVDPKLSIYKQLWVWHLQQTRLVPPLLAVGLPALMAGMILGEVLSPCLGKVCNAWEVWAGMVLGVAGGFFSALAGALLISYLIQVRSIKSQLSNRVEVVLKRRRVSNDK